MFAWLKKQIAVAPLVEALERRQLLCGHMFNTALAANHGSGHGGKTSETAGLGRNGIVTFTGGSGIDWMFVSADESSVTVQINGVDHVFDRAKVKGISLSGGAGDDTILVFDNAGSFDIPVTMTGGRGNDDLEGGAERDYLDGGEDNDYMFGNGGNDVMFGGDGNDIMNGGDGNDVMMGGDGDDLMGGGNGDDRLSGNTGNDQLFGEAGDDHLNGGSGTDLMQGDDGADLFSSSVDTQAERIMDSLDTVV